MPDCTTRQLIRPISSLKSDSSPTTNLKHPKRLRGGKSKRTRTNSKRFRSYFHQRQGGPSRRSIQTLMLNKRESQARTICLRASLSLHHSLTMEKPPAANPTSRRILNRLRNRLTKSLRGSPLLPKPKRPINQVTKCKHDPK